MENKKIESNIFSSVVAEPAVNPEANAAVLFQFVVMVTLVTPIIDSDEKWCGLNQ